MMQTNKIILDGWKETALGEVGIVVTGKTPSKDNPEEWGDLLDFITPADFVSDSKYLSNVVRKLSREGKERFQQLIILASPLLLPVLDPTWVK